MQDLQIWWLVSFAGLVSVQTKQEFLARFVLCRDFASWQLSALFAVSGAYSKVLCSLE